MKIKRRWKFTYLLFALTLIVFTKRAPWLLAREVNGTQKERFYLELKGGQELFLQGNIANSFIQQADFPQIGWIAYFNGSDLQRNLSAYAYETAPRAKLRATYGEFSFEFTPFRWLGVGMDYHNSQYTIHNAKRKLLFRDGTIPMYFYFFLQPIPQPILDNLILLETLQPLLHRNTQVLNIATTDYNVNFHLHPHSIIDPYFRIIYGNGKDNYSRYGVFRIGTALGVRIYLGHIYWLAELAAVKNFSQLPRSRYDIFRGKSSSHNGKLGHWNDLGEGYAQMGLGVAI